MTLVRGAVEIGWDDALLVDPRIGPQGNQLAVKGLDGSRSGVKEGGPAGGMKVGAAEVSSGLELLPQEQGPKIRRHSAPVDNEWVVQVA